MLTIGGDAIWSLAPFTLHFAKELEHHQLFNSAKGEVLSRVEGGGLVLLQFLITHIIKHTGKFRAYSRNKKLIKPISNITGQSIK